MRLRNIVAPLGITDRSAYCIVTDLTAAGYVVKQKTAAATATRSSSTSRCQALSSVSAVLARVPPDARLQCGRLPVTVRIVSWPRPTRDDCCCDRAPGAPLISAELRPVSGPTSEHTERRKTMRSGNALNP